MSAFRSAAEIAAMPPAERSRTVRREADLVLEAVGLFEALEALGPVTPTGSYFLDLMVYPDIDLYIPPVSAADLLGAGGRVANNPAVVEVKFERPLRGELAGGLYMKPRIALGNWGRPWKVDIWSLAPELIARKQEELSSLGKRMTPEQRDLVLAYKVASLTTEHRTPVFSGLFIYRAVVDEGLASFAAISDYLRANGINLA